MYTKLYETKFEKDINKLVQGLFIHFLLYQSFPKFPQILQFKKLSFKFILV